MTSGATVVFAPTWLVPGRIPDQPGARSHRFATDRIKERTVSGSRELDSDVCTACIEDDTRKPDPIFPKAATRMAESRQSGPR